MLCLRPEAVASSEEEADEEPDPEHATPPIEFRALLTFSAITTMTAPSTSGRANEATLQLRALLVRSVIRASVPQVRMAVTWESLMADAPAKVIFDCCVAGQTLTTDLKLWNKSPFATSVLFLAKVGAPLQCSPVPLAMLTPSAALRARR